jgi:hypothetical protein
MKACKRCGEVKPLTAFHKHSQMRDGRLNVCRLCRAEQIKAYPSRTNEVRSAEYHRTEAGRTAKHRWGVVNPLAKKAAQARYIGKRRARVRRELTELDRFVIGEAEALRVMRESATGIKWHADHIVPLHHAAASGLHNGFNIQVVPASWNVRKINKSMQAYFPVAA